MARQKRGVLLGAAIMASAIAGVGVRRLWVVAALALLPFSPAQAAETVTYTYDALGRLVKVVHSGTVNNGQQTDYTLDPAGNRSKVTTTGVSR